MSYTNKAVYLLERTIDAVSNIIGFYSSEELAIAAVNRHVETTINEAVTKSHESTGQYTGIYIQEGFMISKNEVEIEDAVDFDKIEDPDEFVLDPKTVGEVARDLLDHHPAEDLGDVN